MCVVTNLTETQENIYPHVIRLTGWQAIPSRTPTVGAHISHGHLLNILQINSVPIYVVPGTLVPPSMTFGLG